MTLDPAGEATERWLPVGGYEGRYEVSDQGLVRSLSRYFPHPRNPAKQMRTPERILTIRPAAHDGYAVAALCYARQPCRFKRVHLLVANAFLGPRPDGMECRHLNGDRMDPRLVNLAWGTHAENMRDMFDHGRNHHACAVACPRDHPLEAPNLVASKLREGRRNCLACARAKAAIHNAFKRSGTTLDLKTLSDAYFAELSADHASTPNR